MAHVGSPDTFFGGKAGPYDVRVSVRLPGVIPGRAQVTVRVTAPGGVTTSGSHHVTVRAGQWNVGLKGAPPAESASAVPGDPSLFSSELWFMTAQPYELSVVVDGPQGRGDVLVPVMAVATAEKPMSPWLGGVLAALGVFLTLGMLTIIGAAVRESGLAPGEVPDRRRRIRARIGIAVAGILAALILWGGNAWWGSEASAYSRFIVYRPFTATASATGNALTLGIRDPRWTGRPFPQSMYNALTPDHGKLMHLFMVRDDGNAMAHLHPIARTPQMLDFDDALPPLPPGRYRVYADITHESGYAQTLVSAVDVRDTGLSLGLVASDPDDSFFNGTSAPEIVWDRGNDPIVAGKERDLRFSVRDASGALVDVEPYMGMAAHVVVASRDGSVFAHLHPAGSISMAALQRFTGGAADPHAGHGMPLATMPGSVAIPYAFPKPGAYRTFVQIKRDGTVRTAAFDVTVQ